VREKERDCLVLIEIELSANNTLLKALALSTYPMNVSNFTCVPRADILIESSSTQKRLMKERAKEFQEQQHSTIMRIEDVAHFTQEKDI
jgi:hypothetical protein